MIGESRKWAVRALVCVLAVLGSLVVTTGAASAARCFGGSCTGKDPEALGCSADARTLEQVYSYANGPIWELRFSSSCNAAWARMLNGGLTSDEVNLDGRPPEPVYPPYTFNERWAGYPGSVWTRMGAGRDATRVCGRFGSAGGQSQWYCSKWY